MKKLLNICHNFAITHDVIINCNKTKGIVFTSRHLKLNLKPNVKAICPVVQSPLPTTYVTLGTHLGCVLSDQCDVNQQARYLYGIANELCLNFVRYFRYKKFFVQITL